MSILGEATTVTATLTRATSNALRIQLANADGTELARAQQKGGAAVLFGFKNGGKSDYTLSNSAGDELRIAVAGTTTITQQGTVVGKIVPTDGFRCYHGGTSPNFGGIGSRAVSSRSTSSALSISASPA